MEQRLSVESSNTILSLILSLFLAQQNDKNASDQPQGSFDDKRVDDDNDEEERNRDSLPH